MNLRDQYKSNRPLFNSVLTGLFYFFFCWSIDFGEATVDLFYFLMIFLPGLSFPLTTSYYNVGSLNKLKLRILFHLALSALIYYGVVLLFATEGLMPLGVVLAAFSGSLLFLLVTKYLLRKNISILQIILTAIASGLTFLICDIFDRYGFFIGVSVLLWTLVNGFSMNIEYRRSRKG